MKKVKEYIIDTKNNKIKFKQRYTLNQVFNYNKNFEDFINKDNYITFNENGVHLALNFKSNSIKMIININDFFNDNDFYKIINSPFFFYSFEKVDLINIIEIIDDIFGFKIKNQMLEKLI